MTFCVASMERMKDGIRLEAVEETGTVCPVLQELPREVIVAWLVRESGIATGGTGGLAFGPSLAA